MDWAKNKDKKNSVKCNSSLKAVEEMWQGARPLVVFCFVLLGLCLFVFM